MPIYEYVCKQCSRRFEVLVYGGQKPQCPHCKSAKLEQQLSVFAVAASGKGAAAEGGACGTCGDPRGPGSCSLDDVD